jgi:hypothetical protein
MGKVQKGRRKGENDALFTKPTTKEGVTPDRVSPAVEGYYHLPARWIGEQPNSNLVTKFNPTILHETVLSRAMNCGIHVRVRRDGLFLFDFSNCSVAPMITIPGYLIDDPSSPSQATKEHQEAEAKAEEIAILRAQIMNIHQVCLAVAFYNLRYTSTMSGFQVNSSNTIKSWSLDHDPEYYDDPEDVYELARNVLNNSHNIAGGGQTNRIVMDMDVVNHSFDLLDKILMRDDLSLIRLLDAACMSASLRREKRNGESIAVGFTVCEQILSIAWKRLIEAFRVLGISKRGCP